MRNSEPPVDAVQRELFLRTLSVGSASKNVAAQLARYMRSAHFAKGDVLYAAGSPPTDIFFVVHGEVALSAEGRELWQLVAPAVVGVFDAVSGREHARSAVAATDVDALTLSQEEWFDALEEHFSFARQSVLRASESLALVHLDLAPDGGFPKPTPEEDGSPRMGMNLVERILLLRSTPAFEHATVQATARLANAAEEVEVRAGRVVHEIGAPKSMLSIVASGSIGIHRPSPNIDARFGPGQMIGGVGSFGGSEYLYTSTALTRTVLLEIRRDDVFEIMEDHAILVRAVLASVAQEREQAVSLRADRAKGHPPTAAESHSPGVVEAG